MVELVGVSDSEVVADLDVEEEIVAVEERLVEDD